MNVSLRNIKKISKYESTLSLSHFDALPKGLQQLWSCLCEIAFQTLCEDKIVFSHEDLSKKFQGLSSGEEVLCFGLLQSAESILVDGHGVSFHFLHLTFQEYLAALYLVRQPPDKQLQLCQSYAGSKRFNMVWRFFFGISSTVCNQSINSGVSKVLVDDCEYAKSTLTLCHVAFEANHMHMYNLVTSEIKNGRYVEFFAHTAFDFAAVIGVITNLQDCRFSINLLNCCLGDKQIAALADALAGEHKKLQVLSIDLSGNNLTDQNVANLFDRASLAFSQSLLSIGLENGMIGPKAINSITTVLAKSLHENYNDSSGLYIEYNPLEIEGLKALRDAICTDKLANLTILSLAGSLTSDADTNAELILALGSGHCHSLEKLDLSRNNLGVPGGKALGKVLPHLHEVSLNLDKTMLGDEGISTLTRNLEDICEISLKSNGIHAAGISCLAVSICIGNIPLVVDFVSLANNPLGVEGFLAVVKLLSGDHFWAYTIDLSGCQLTTAGGSVTFPNAKTVRQLICSQQLQTNATKLLLIDSNNFTGEGIHILAAFMYVCPSLERLYCRNCGITSDDLKQLLVQVSDLKLKWSYLKLWDLGNNDIDDDGVSTLIQHLSMFPNMGSIDLNGNIQVSPGMLETFEEKLDARCEVHLHAILIALINPRCMREGYCSRFVCVSVCLSVCLSVPELHATRFVCRSKLTY